MQRKITVIFNEPEDIARLDALRGHDRSKFPAVLERIFAKYAPREIDLLGLKVEAPAA